MGTFAYTMIFDNQTYDVQGRVAGFKNDTTLFVEHERIPGYMPPMTMPLPVRDAGLLNGLDMGDAIQFRLRVSEERAEIVELWAIADSLVAQDPAQNSSMQAPTRGPTASTVSEGDRVPADLTLMSQAGDSLRIGDCRGDILVLTFIYTRCPIPNYCPRMSKHFATLQPKLRAEYGERVQLLSISFDPAHDTPAVLQDYASRYTDRLDTWTFATGDSSQVRRATSLFGVYTSQGDGEITHNLVTAVVGSDGTVERLFRGNEWTPTDVMQAVAAAE
ncbi:electron transporter [Salinibacter sp. 10B]|nr:electron transporter [Salinibacter sp. 10B]